MRSGRPGLRVQKANRGLCPPGSPVRTGGRGRPSGRWTKHRPCVGAS